MQKRRQSRRLERTTTCQMQMALGSLGKPSWHCWAVVQYQQSGLHYKHYSNQSHGTCTLHIPSVFKSAPPLRVALCCVAFAPCLRCRGASAAAAGGAFASRFSFQGGLAPVVMVSGSGSVVPWRCPIDSFTGDEDVPQVLLPVLLGGTAGIHCLRMHTPELRHESLSITAAPSIAANLKCSCPEWPCTSAAVGGRLRADGALPTEPRTQNGVPAAAAAGEPS